MRRALPYTIFGLVTLVVFWNFFKSGQTLFAAPLIEVVLGSREPPAPGRFPGHSRVGDNAILLPSLLKVYNEGLKAGELRLWNPYLFCGYPVYADPMVHPFYPPQVVLQALFPPRIGFEVSLLLHFFFSGTCMFWASRALKVSEPGSTIAGLVWMLFGYNAVWFSTGILMGVSVFMPLALMWLVQGLERRDWSRAPFCGLSMGMVILGSHPQHALHFFILLIAWVTVAAWRDPANRGTALRFGIVVVCLSVGVAMAEVSARLDTIASGYRRTGPDLGLLYGSPTALCAQAAGMAIGMIPFHTVSSIDQEFNVFAGLCALTLSVVGSVRAFKEPWVRFLVVFAIAAFLVAFLRPLATLMQMVPLLRLSPPSRWLCVFGFCLALLAGRGLDSFKIGMGRVPQVLSAAVGLFILTCLAKLGPLNFENGVAKLTVMGLGLTVIAAYLGGRNPRHGVVAVFLAMAAELLVNFLLLNQHYGSGAFESPPDLVQKAALRQKDPWRATGWMASPSVKIEERAVGDKLSVLSNNGLSVYGVEVMGGFEAIIPAHYIRFIEAAGGGRTDAGRAIFFKEYDSHLLDVAGMKYVFTTRNTPPGDRFKLIGTSGSLNLYENHDVLPRAYLVSGISRTANEEESAALLRSSAFRPRESVVVQTTDEIPPGTPGSIPGDVRWLERTSDRIGLEVSSSQDGFLVLSDTDYPGWRATVDGQDTRIYRANLAFRAIRISAGSHRVEFRFSPQTVRYGMIVSILSVAFGLGWIAYDRRWRGASPQAAV